MIGFILTGRDTSVAASEGDIHQKDVALTTALRMNYMHFLCDCYLEIFEFFYFKFFEILMQSAALLS